MVLSGIKRLNPASGRYCVLADYGTEGLGVHSQHATLEEAIAAIGTGVYNDIAVVELVDFTPIQRASD